jgi:predicted Zn-dependent peptidase
MPAIAERLVASKKEGLGIVPEASVFVPRDKEQEYCHRHNITLRRLFNGSTIVGAFRESQDRATANFTLTFPEGGYKDPPGKEGVYHFLEHLIVYPILDFANESDASVNAFTTPEDVNIYLSGSANPDVKKHGVWPVIPRLFHSLFTHLRDAKDLPKKLATEKKIVYQEMDRHEGPEKRVEKFLGDKLYHPKNPRRYDSLGTRDSIANLQVADVINILDRIIIPDKAIASVFVNGNEKARDELVEDLDQQMQQFPQTDQKRKKIDPELSELINPELKPGSVFEQQVEGLSPEGALDVNYVWVFPAEQFSTAASAASSMSTLLHNNFFKYMRDQGISYVQNAFQIQLEHSTIVGLHFRVKKTPDAKEKILQNAFSDIQDQVLSKITEKDLEELHERSQLDLAATPVSINERFHAAIYGIHEKDMIMDPDKIRDIEKNVTIDDYKNWLQRLTTTLPATILAGNVKDDAQ